MVAAAQGTAGVTLRLVDARPGRAAPSEPPAKAAPEPASEPLPAAHHVSLRAPATFLAGLVALLIVIVLTVGSIVDVLLVPGTVVQTTTVATPVQAATAPDDVTPDVTPVEQSPPIPPIPPPPPQPSLP